jgi:hypothetical protein
MITLEDAEFDAEVECNDSDDVDLLSLVVEIA